MLEQRFKKTCHKILFKSKQEAKNYIKKTNKDGKHLKDKLTDAYYCEECSSWHVTSMSKTMRSFYRKRKEKQ